MRKNSIGKGVMVAVKDAKGNPLTPDAYGCLGNLEAGKYFLQVSVDLNQRARGDFFGLERQGAIHAILKKDYMAETAGRVFKRTLEVYEGDGKGNYVSYPNNHFKLLELYKNGAFKIWEVGITMRNRKFYLVAQDVWRERAYRDGETVVIPAVSDWTSLRKVIYMTDAERRELELHRNEKKFVAIVPHDHENLLSLKDLEPASRYISRPEITADGLGENQGRVTWWNDCHGMGAIITPFGSARVHRNNLAPSDEFISLEKGDVIEFDELIEPKDSRSSFKNEAIGIRPRSYEDLAAEMLSGFINPENRGDLNGAHKRVEALGLD